MTTMQSKKRCGSIYALICGVSLLLAAPARGQEGLGERLGEKLDRGIDRLSETFQEGWDSLRSAVNRMGVQGRVYARLRWDKHISTEAIEVDVDKSGVVVLRGQLKDAEAKRTAVKLANDTIGVERVIDEITLPATETSAVRDR